jgi:hypothetical protein
MTRLSICGVCGSLWEPTATQRQRGRRTCDGCTSPDPRWTREYKRARAKRLGLCHGRCERCERKVKLEAHHVDGNPANHDWTNLRMLCASCHPGKGRPSTRQGRLYAEVEATGTFTEETFFAGMDAVIKDRRLQ